MAPGLHQKCRLSSKYKTTISLKNKVKTTERDLVKCTYQHVLVCILRDNFIWIQDIFLRVARRIPFEDIRLHKKCNSVGHPNFTLIPLLILLSSKVWCCWVLSHSFVKKLIKNLLRLNRPHCAFSFILLLTVSKCT